jgi:hypothetical protein
MMLNASCLSSLARQITEIFESHTLSGVIKDLTIADATLKSLYVAALNDPYGQALSEKIGNITGYITSIAKKGFHRHVRKVLSESIGTAPMVDCLLDDSMVTLNLHGALVELLTSPMCIKLEWEPKRINNFPGLPEWIISDDIVADILAQDNRLAFPRVVLNIGQPFATSSDIASVLADPRYRPDAFSASLPCYVYLGPNEMSHAHNPEHWFPNVHSFRYTHRELSHMCLPRCMMVIRVWVDVGDDVECQYFCGMGHTFGEALCFAAADALLVNGIPTLAIRKNHSNPVDPYEHFRRHVLNDLRTTHGALIQNDI